MFCVLNGLRDLLLDKAPNLAILCSEIGPLVGCFKLGPYLNQAKIISPLSILTVLIRREFRASVSQNYVRY